MYTRRPKESHRDTVTYEIDMLDFCARKARREHSEAAEQGSLPRRLSTSLSQSNSLLQRRISSRGQRGPKLGEFQSVE